MGKWQKVNLKNVTIEVRSFEHPDYGEFKEYTISKGDWLLMGKPKRTSPVGESEVNLFYEQSRATINFKKQNYFHNRNNELIPYVLKVELPMNEAQDFFDSVDQIDKKAA